MFSKTKSAPGILTSIEGIPTGIVNNHNEAFFYWMESNLKKATLFHVDAHPDMKNAVYIKKVESAYDYDKMNTANFICPAVNLEIISSIYWMNPHSIERRLQELGLTETGFKKPLKSYRQENKSYFLQKKFNYLWGSFHLELGKGEIKTKDNLAIPQGPLILDIDIDAFCCHLTKTIRYLPVSEQVYDGVSGFEKRIDETIDVLATLPRPYLITIATSLGDGKDECYVPPSMVERVMQYLDDRLEELFSRCRQLS